MFINKSLMFLPVIPKYVSSKTNFTCMFVHKHIHNEGLEKVKAAQTALISYELEKLMNLLSFKIE